MQRYIGRHNRRGYILIALAFGITFLLGMAGLAIDIGRMYVTKSEAQSFVDSAALAAVSKLDGTDTGLTHAGAAVNGDPKLWAFGTAAFPATAKYSNSPAGPWTASPPSPPAGYYYVQVTTSVSLPMYLIRVLAGDRAQIAAVAVAGRTSMTTFAEGGEFPFSPYSRKAAPDDSTDPFGFRIGDQYTLRWGSPGTNSTCGTDGSNPSLATNGKIRGYCCVANNSPSIRQAILGGQTDPLSVGQSVPMDTGAKDTEMTTIADRVDADTDTSSASYAQYLASGAGNGERVVVVPVNSGAPNYINIGFAGFFLLNRDAYNKLHGNDSACAEYIGTWVKGVATPQPVGTGAYRLKLFQ
jgi:Flp pilus assembly protein TadG